MRTESPAAPSARSIIYSAPIASSLDLISGSMQASKASSKLSNPEPRNLMQRDGRLFDSAIGPFGLNKPLALEEFLQLSGLEYGLGVLFCHPSEYARFGGPCN
jgi:hypothetical protein